MLNLCLGRIHRLQSIWRCIIPSNWTKQPQQLLATRLNAGSGDAVEGGALASVPSNVLGANQGSQTHPGDRLVIGSLDAAALSLASVGTLYGGLYQYVSTYSGSAGTPTKYRLAFWQPSNAAPFHQVTPDESGTPGVAAVAGVFINTLTAGYDWWILIAGRTPIQFRAALTGVPSAGCAVYCAAAGAGADLGTLDVLAGAPLASYTDIDNANTRYMGWAETAPVGGATAIVNVPLRRVAGY